jgi:hypothetical protein
MWSNAIFPSETICASLSSLQCPAFLHIHYTIDMKHIPFGLTSYESMAVQDGAPRSR